jgi:Cu/Ag efflux protein CusF
MPTEKAVEETAAESQLDIEDFVAGTVASVDATEKKITVNSEEGGEVVIYVNDATEIYLWDDQVKLGELKANDEVEIGYVTDQSKKNMATWVDIYREDAKAKAQGATPAQ